MRTGAALGLLSPGFLFQYRDDVSDTAGSFGIQLPATVTNAGPGGLLHFLQRCRAGTDGCDYPLSANFPAIADHGWRTLTHSRYSLLSLGCKLSAVVIVSTGHVGPADSYNVEL
jgi:hypothetical protein